MYIYSSSRLRQVHIARTIVIQTSWRSVVAGCGLLGQHRLTSRKWISPNMPPNPCHYVHRHHRFATVDRSVAQPCLRKSYTERKDRQPRHKPASRNFCHPISAMPFRRQHRQSQSMVAATSNNKNAQKRNWTMTLGFVIRQRLCSSRKPTL